MRNLKKIVSEIFDSISPYFLLVVILIVWQVLSHFEIVARYLLPSPSDVVMAFVKDFDLIMYHTKFTLMEAFFGLLIGVVGGVILSIIMDNFPLLKKMIYPLLILTQTIPTVAIAPLLVLWMGYGLAPKITLIAVTSFFPIVISMLDGFSSIDVDSINLLWAMGAKKSDIYRHVKLPGTLPNFFSGLRISLSYAIVGAVVAEWLGGFDGLGVYMTRVRKSYAFDRMFAVIFFISFLSLILMFLLKKVEQKLIKYNV